MLLYLVSGTSRSGKTIIANNILKRKNIPFMSLDWLVMGFTNGMPQCGIHAVEVITSRLTVSPFVAANNCWFSPALMGPE